VVRITRGCGSGVRAQEEALARDRATDLVLPDLGAAPTKKRSHQKQTPVERP